MSSSLLRTAFGDLAHEFAQTRRMLERLPDAQLAFTPHPKSWALGKLARHLCDFPGWGVVTLQTTELDFDAPRPAAEIPTTTAGFLALWDREMAALQGVLASVTDADLGVEWRAVAGGHVVMRGTRTAILRGMVMSHMIHHRAQLSIYYRLLDVPVPGLYGPSADEK